MGRGILSRIRARRDRAAHHRRFLRSVDHLHGPEGPTTAPDDVIVVALVRDGMFYLDAFLRHYRALGAAQFVFCDNGSGDGTIERLQQEKDVVILRSTLPWGEVENDFRRYAAGRYAPGRWCLYADMDEIFTFEGAEQIGLPGLTRYLATQGYTAMMAQMLEMVPDAALSEASQLTYAEALEAYEWYDLRQITRYDYHDRQIGFAWFLKDNRLANDRLQVLFGGLRARVFDENCCLTKHPLVRIVEGVEPGVHPHAASGVQVAPMTGLIKHYKFAGDAAARDADTLARGVIPHGEDARRMARFKAEPELSLWSNEAQRFEGLAPLYAEGFLQRDAGFDAFLAEQGA